MDFRKLKDEARGVLHDTLRVRALYLETRDATPVPVNVRVHSKWGALGDMKGTSYHFAEHVEQQPKIMFLVSEVAEPKRNAIVSVAPGEAYILDHRELPDGITVTAPATRMPANEAEGLPLPEAA